MKKRARKNHKSKQFRPATVNRELACLKILFNRNEDSVPGNPVRKVKLLNEDNQQMRVLTADEEKLYLLAASQPLQDIALLMNAHTATVKRSKVAPFKLYALRHTFATRAAEAGVDLVTLAALLGHSRLTMVMRYAHPSQEHQFEAMRKVAA